MTSRTYFVALAVPDPVRSQLVKVVEGLRPQIDGVRWVDPDGMHITLKYLGPIDGEEADSVAAVVEAAVATCRPFNVTVEGIGAFPDREETRVVWAGVQPGASADRLANLHRKVELAVEPLGFAPERREFVPHVTLCFVNEEAQVAAASRLVESAPKEHYGEIAVASVVLYASDPTPDGSIYSQLASFPLESP